MPVGSLSGMGDLVDLPDRTAGDLAREQTAKAAAVRHTIVQLAAKGLDTYSIQMRLAKRREQDGGPVMKTEGEIQSVIDDFLERTAKQDKDTVKRLRAIENRRLDLLMEKLEDGIEDGKPSAIKAALAISDRRAKLNGLDAPRRVEHSGEIGHTLIDREAIEAEAEAFRTQHDPFIDAEVVGEQALPAESDGG